MIDALQAGDRCRITPPADWRQGGEIITPPSIAFEKAKMLFPQSWTTTNPYLHTTRILDADS